MIKHIINSGALALGLLLLVVVPAHATSTLYLNSQPGDYIGGGVQTTLTDGDGSFTYADSANVVSISFMSTDNSQWWYLHFASPQNTTLANGPYVGATRWPFQSPTLPGQDISGDGRGCNMSSGLFVVRQIVTDGQGNIISLAIDFEQYCDGATAALLGGIRYNSSVPLIVQNPTAIAGNNQSVAEQSVVTLDGSLSEGGGGSITSYTWTQTAGPTVTLSAPTQAITTFNAPLVPLGGTTFTFNLSVMNNLGLTDNDSVSVHVSSKSDPQTYIYFQSDPGDYIGQGETFTLTSIDGLFSAQSISDNGLEVDYNGGDSWTLDFAPPSGQQLVPGTYLNVQRYPFQTAGVPGLSVYGAGRGCNTLTGQFTILAPGGAPNPPNSFGADFVQHCEGAAAALNGSVRYNFVDQHVPTADAGQAIQAVPGSTVTLDASSSHSNDGDQLVSYAWSQISGTSVSQSTPNNVSTTFIMPAATGDPNKDMLVFALLVTDDQGYMNQATVDVTPIAMPIAVTGTLSAVHDHTATGTLQASGGNGNPLTYSIMTQPSHGQVVLNNASTGAYTYTPNNLFVGSDSFTFNASDGSQSSNTATINITVIDNAPVTTNGTLSVNENAEGNGTLLATDADNDPLIYMIASQPQHGTVTLNDVSIGAYTYKPATGYSGSDSFTFKASDSIEGSNTSMVSITVNAVSGGTTGGTSSSGGGGGVDLLCLACLFGLLRYRRSGVRLRAKIY